MAEQPWFHVFGAERFGQERIAHQVDLADGQVVRGAPMGVEGTELLVVHGFLRNVGYGDLSFPDSALPMTVR